MNDKNKNKGVADGERQEFQARPGAAASRTLKVRRIGNSLGVVLPREVLAKLRVGEGDALSVSETPDGVSLTPYDGEIERQLSAARDIMGRYRNALRELAK